MELHQALTQISQIREHIARTETFRGFRWLTVGCSGLLAFAAAAAQEVWVPAPREQFAEYLTLWVGVAAVSVVLIGAEMAVRILRAASPWSIRLTWVILEQFLPCVLAGGLLTFVLVLYATDAVWMLPGLWSIVFSLGVFASWRLLPKATFGVAVYYLVAGVFCLAFAQGELALSPWAMAGTFGVGQVATAAILYYSLERHHGQSKTV
jgi:hypothetical protein